MREFLGPDMFHALLTANPTRWPLHAWVNLPLIPFSLIASRTPLLLWSTSPLVPLLFPWPTSVPIASQLARGSNGALRPVHPTRLWMWPPPPALVCALFPFVRVLYERLRNRVMRALVQDHLPPQPQTAQQQQEQQREREREQQRREEHLRQLRRLAGQDQLRQGWAPRQQQQQQPLPQPQEQPNQEQQQRQPEHRFQFQVGDQFHLEITHFMFNRNAHAPAPDAAGPAPPIAGPAGNVVDQQPQQPAQEERPLADPEPQQQHPPDPQEQQLEEQPQPPQQEHGQEQEQEQEQQGEPQVEQGQREPQEEGQGQAAQHLDDDNFGAVAARAIRMTGSSLGRLIGGALAMPTIARMMGAMLLRLSHVVPLVRIIIAPRTRPAAAAVGGLVGLWGRAGSAWRLFGGGDVPAGGVDGGWSGGGIGAKVLIPFLATSQEWATSDPVWYDVFFLRYLLTILTNGIYYRIIRRWRNALGLGIFLVVSHDLIIPFFFLLVPRAEASHVSGEGRVEDPPFAACEEGARRKAHQEQVVFWR